MLEVVILVCSIHLAPADCQVDTATAVIQGPDVANSVLCGLHGQAYLATTGLAAHHDSYLKIRCRRAAVGLADKAASMARP